MTEPTEPPPAGPRLRRRPLRRMILARAPVLPVLVTLLNGVAGFAAIHYATKAGLHVAAAQQPAMSNLVVAAWLIFAAMFFDALDGRIARMTRQATDFGAQLDSLCDAISFGVAPAVLMVHAVSVTREIEDFDIFLVHHASLGKVVMAIAVIYACCAVLRLARFNVENAPDLLHHMGFRGLPAPAAAALVAAMVLLFDMLLDLEKGRWLKITVGTALPALTAATALLMVSRFPYPHVINRFIAGKKRFSTIVIAVMLLVAGLMFRRQVLALAALAYAASGPIAAAVGRLRRRRGGAEDT